MQEKMHHLVPAPGDRPGQPTQLCKLCEHFLHTPDTSIFSERAVRDEDHLALAAEREELLQFLADYEAWLDAQRDTPPSLSDYPHLSDPR